MDLTAGSAIIPIIQASAPWLTLPMLAISTIGSPDLLLLLIAPLAFIYGRVFGTRLACTMGLAIWLSDIVKNIVHSPRPFVADPGITALQVQSGFGFPSTHSIAAVCFFGLLASAQENRLTRYLLLVPIPLIAFSRVFLGVHSPMDVTAGILLGTLLLVAVLIAERPIRRLFRPDIHPARTVAAAVAISAGMVLFSAAAVAAQPPGCTTGEHFPLRDGLLASGFFAGAVAGSLLVPAERISSSRGRALLSASAIVIPFLLLGWAATREAGGLAPLVTFYCAALLLGVWITAVPAALGERLMGR